MKRLELYNDKLKKSVKVGDTVIIKSLEEVKKINEQYVFPFVFAEEMYKLCGKKAKVVAVKKKYCDENRIYWESPRPNRFALDMVILDIDGGYFSWSLDMFQWKNTTMMIKNE